MVNVDHAGAGNGRITIGVSEVPKPVVLQAAKQAGISERVDVFGFFPGGDHVPFKEAGVPAVAIVSGGTHPDFHRPTDVPAAVSPHILEAVARYVAALVGELANGVAQ
jgi:Zn-dependent M28 family amino/carboxypeptidase